MRMKLQLRLFAVASLALLNAPVSSADPDYEAMFSLRTSAGFSNALEASQVELSNDPNNGLAWAVSALVYANGVDFLGMTPAEAREGMDRALAEAFRLDAQGAYTRAAYGLIRQTEDPENAERKLRECIEDTPEFLECHNLYGDMLRKTNRLEQAEYIYQRALERWPYDGELLVSYALQLQETGRVSEALQMLRSLAAEQSAFPRGHWHLATMLYETGGDLAESRQAAVRALELDPLIWNGELFMRMLDQPENGRDR